MGTHLLRLALLLATLQYAAIQATGLVMDELLKNGGRILLKSRYNHKYLTGGVNLDSWSVTMRDGPPGNAEHWTIVPISDTKVAIRSSNGHFIRHDTGVTINLMYPAKSWEHWTPVKNWDGSWSFTNEWKKWLSAHRWGPDGKVVAGDNNNDCEKWILAGTWELGPVMKEVLANGGRHFVKPTFNLKYITGEVDPGSYSVTQKAGPPGEASHWTFVQTSDTEVALRASNFKFLGHRSPIALRDTIEWWENWTPVKNADGRWSLRSRWYGYWLSARFPESDLVVEANNLNCEMFWLDKWQPRDTLIEELTKNGGRYMLKSPGGYRYLTQKDSEVVLNPAPLTDTNHWTIVQKSDTQVALRASNGKFLRHNREDALIGVNDKYFIDLADSFDLANSWEMWTPAKNADGSWSFKCKNGGYDWMSAKHSHDGIVKLAYKITPNEHWRLVDW